MNPFQTSRNPRPTLSDAWPDFPASGIFMAFRALPNAGERFPWLGDLDDTISLDMLYFLNHSGKKLVSNLVERFCENGVITNGGKSIVAKAVAFKYERNWSKLWNTLIITYDPASNYNVVTTRELTKADNEDESLNTTKTGSEGLTHGLTQTTTHGKTVTDDSSIFGYDSPSNSPVPSDKDVSTESGTTSVANTGSDTTERDFIDDSTRLKSTEGEELEEIHKSGVIGTVSIQRLLSEERGVWVWNFFDQIFKDLDKELALSVYDACR